MLVYSFEFLLIVVVLTFRDGVEPKSALSVISARLLFSVLGFLMLGMLIYTIATDGSPFRRELLTP